MTEQVRKSIDERLEMIEAILLETEKGGQNSADAMAPMLQHRTTMELMKGLCDSVDQHYQQLTDRCGALERRVSVLEGSQGLA